MAPARVLDDGLDMAGLVGIAVGGVEEIGVALDHLRRLGEPIAVGQPPGEAREAALLPAETAAKRFLDRGDPVLAALLLVAEAQHLLASVEQSAQQLALPAVPGARPDRADVDDGEHEQQPQPLEALHVADEVLDRLGVGEIALEGGSGHQEVPAHQPGDGLGLGRTEAEPGAERERDLCPQFAMVAAAALGDVVEQHRDVERPARRDQLEQGGREPVLLAQFALLDPREQADGADRMLVDGVMVVHVELQSGRRPGRNRE